MTAPTAITRTAGGYQYGNLLVSGLPRAQSHALLLRARGMSSVDAAALMGCSVQNVKQSLSTLFFKTGSDSSPALITRAFECGLLRVLTLAILLGIGCLGKTVTEDVRRGGRQQIRTARRASRSGGSSPQLLIWDDKNNQFFTTSEVFNDGAC